MGCDSSIRASAVQLLVLGLCLQHMSASLSASSAIKLNSDEDNRNIVFNNRHNDKDSESDREGEIAKIRITRADKQKRKYEDYSDDVQNYLMNFGYLPKTDIETGNLRSESQLIDAIKSLQTIGHIPATGVIDEQTKSLMTRPRCGLPDSEFAREFYADNQYGRTRRRQKRFVVLGRKWEKTDLTWSLQGPVNMNYSTGTVRRVLHDSLNVWAKNSKLTFREVNGADADILVSFVRRNHGDGHPFEGPGGVLAHAFYPGPGIGGDAHFDDEETWLIDKEDNHGTNLMGAAVHEFGHSLGLGHSSVQDSIMFPWYQSYDPTQDLPEDDRTGIQEIYGSTSRQWGKNPYARPQTPPRTTTTTTTTTPRTPPPTRVFYPERRYPEREPERRDPDRNDPERREPDPRDERQHHHHHHHHHHPNHHHPNNRPPYHHRPNKDGGDSGRRYNTDRRRVYTERPTFTNSVDSEDSPTRRPHSPRTEEDRNGIPDKCDTSYDAITIIRGQLFIFKNKYLWRFGENGQIMNGYPSEIRQHWRDLPEDMTHIDTVYENKEMQIVFFIGKKMYVFNSDRLEPGYPRPLSDLGLPPTVEKLDAVLVWSHNNRTYFYSGRNYWRFDEDHKKVELDYPREMSMWGGLGNDIDSAFQWKDHKTYFFKGKGFWRFIDHKMVVAHERPRSSAQFWMKCPKGKGEEQENFEGRRERIISAGSTSLRASLALMILVGTIRTLF